MPYKDRQMQLNAQREHYKQNKQHYLDVQNALRDRNRRYVWEYLQGKQCIVCGEPDPLVLEFDHREPDDKDCRIAMAMVTRKFSLERLQKELDKCDILCANCHKRKSAKQLGFHKLNY